LRSFERIVVAIDGEPEGQQALQQAIALAALLHARFPAYPATGEVEDAKREKDEYFETVARLARDEAAEGGVELDTELESPAVGASIGHEIRWSDGRASSGQGSP